MGDIVSISDEWLSDWELWLEKVEIAYGRSVLGFRNGVDPIDILYDIYLRDGAIEDGVEAMRAFDGLIGPPARSPRPFFAWAAVGAGLGILAGIGCWAVLMALNYV
jgi:hypothetical protein